MIEHLLVAIGIFWIFIHTIASIRNHQRIIRRNTLLIGKGKKKRKYEYIFVEEKGCSYCGKPISKEEYENERYGYCKECTEDLMTEEEDYGDTEKEGLWRI